MKINVLSLSHAKNNCSDLFCDRQRSTEKNHMAEVVVVIRWILEKLTLLLLTISIFYHNGDSAFLVKDFTSLKFSALFQDKPLPTSTCFHNLDETDHSENLFGCIAEILHHINFNGFFSVTG